MTATPTSAPTQPESQLRAEWCRPAAYILCFDEQQRLLVTKLRAVGNESDLHWTLPGGGMDWGESAEETAHREVYEETGLAVTLGAILGTVSTWFEAKESIHGAPGHSIGIIFAAANPVGKLLTTFPEDESTIEATWMDLDTLRSEPCVPLIDRALELLGSDFE